MAGNTVATTPLQGWPIPVNGDDPDIPGDMAALAKAIEKKVVGIYATTADRDAKITAPTEGQFAYVLGQRHRLLLHRRTRPGRSSRRCARHQLRYLGAAELLGQKRRRVLQGLGQWRSTRTTGPATSLPRART